MSQIHMNNIYALTLLQNCAGFTSLTGVDMATLINLAHHAVHDATSAPTVATIASETRLHRTTVMRSLQHLMRSGVIQCVGTSPERTKAYRLACLDRQAA